MTECDAEVRGDFPRSHCGRDAVTMFVDDIEGVTVPCCKIHAPAYRRNPRTWREVKIKEPIHA